MDKEEFYEMLLAFAKNTQQSNKEEFDIILNSIEVDNDMKDQFSDMVSSFICSI